MHKAETGLRCSGRLCAVWGAVCRVRGRVPGLGAPHPCTHPSEVLTGMSPFSAVAQGPALAESPLQGSFSAGRLPVESVPETHALLSSLRGQRKDTWSQKHWDALPSSQKPWSLEPTVIKISGSCQEVPHVWTVAPYTQVPKGLPVIEEEEYGMKVTPVVSVEEGCSPEEATEPGSSTKVPMIVEPEDPEPEDRAAQPAWSRRVPQGPRAPLPPELLTQPGLISNSRRRPGPRGPPSDPALPLQTPPSTVRPHTLREGQEGRGST